jgi:transcriptional regulator with XRE-family HTH domain
MQITPQLSDDAILRELGARLMRERIAQNLTQADLAEQAGVAKRTVERIEAGGATQVLNLVRICRALGLTENLGALVPEPMASPLALLKSKGRERQRASVARLQVHSPVANYSVTTASSSVPPTPTSTRASTPTSAPTSGGASKWQWADESPQPSAGVSSKPPIKPQP